MGALAGRGLPSRLGKPKQRITAKPKQAEQARRSVNWLHTAAWQRLRVKVLKRDGYVCQRTGVLLVGKHPAPDSPVVDHKIPHRGDPQLFWDINNLQSVSKEWHDSEKQRLERRGLV